MISRECPVCSSTRQNAKLISATYELLECVSCKLLWDPQTNPSTNQQYGENYFSNDAVKGGYANYFEAMQINRRTFVWRLNNLAKGGRGKLLDVGCALGACLEEAKKLGWEKAIGLDLSQYATDFARKNGLEVEQGSLMKHPFSPRSFDQILMQDMIEHVTDPLTHLREAHKLLQPGGSLLLITPNTQGVWSRLLKRAWYHFKPGEHLVYFNPTSLRLALERTGFVNISVKRTYNYLSIGYILDRLRYLLPSVIPPLVRLAKFFRVERIGVWIPIDEMQAHAEVPKVERLKAVTKNGIVVVPTYNEAANIAPMIDLLSDNLPGVHVLVVDDNSPDGTGTIVEQIQKRLPHVHLLSREKKNGLAAAYNAGFDWAINAKYDFVIQMDADFSHRPQDLPQMIAALNQGANAAIGSRYTSEGRTQGWARWRRYISKSGNWYAKRMLGLGFEDLTGGFNVWSAEVLRKIGFSTIKSRGYSYQVELKWRAHLAGFKLTEVPIQFNARAYGSSKMSFQIVHEAAIRVFQLRRGKRALQAELNASQSTSKRNAA